MPAHTLQSLVAVAHEAGQLWEKLPTLEGAPAHDAFLDEPKGSPRYVLGARRQIPASIHCTGESRAGGTRLIRRSRRRGTVPSLWRTDLKFNLLTVDVVQGGECPG